MPHVRYQLGVRDETLRRELCKIKNPSLAEFDTLLEAHTLMEASEKQRNKTVQANMTEGPQRKSPPNPNKIRLSEEKRKRRKQFRGKCYRCGAGDHMILQCKLPANVTCLRHLREGSFCGTSRSHHLCTLPVQKDATTANHRNHPKQPPPT